MLRTTRENLNKPMAVVFIEKERELVQRNGHEVAVDRSKEEVISVASIRGVFSNNFQITGSVRGGGHGACEAAARRRARRADHHRRAARHRPERRQGQHRRRRTRALAIAGIVLFAFMALYYRIFGVIADIVLLTNVVLIVAMLALFNAALTLPGIAGIVLTVGTAVDANILIYEREYARRSTVGASPWPRSTRASTRPSPRSRTRTSR